MKSGKIKILLIDRHLSARKAINILLASDKRFQVIGECLEDAAAIRKVRQLNPDIILLNIDMNMIYGSNAIGQILADNPLAKIIAVSMCNTSADASKIMKLGTKGYVTITSEIMELIKAIVEVEKGNNYICSEVKG